MEELTLGVENLVGNKATQLIVDEVVENTTGETIEDGVVEQPLEELTDLNSELENDELVPMDEDDIEDLVQESTDKTEPELKPINANQLAALLLHVKGQRVGFKFGEVYFEITDVDARKGTFTASPANEIIGTFNPPRPPKQKLSQRNKKKRRKKGRR